MRSIAASVLVGVDPSTAFMAFTEEMDLWGSWPYRITSTWPAVGTDASRVLAEGSSRSMTRKRVRAWSAPASRSGSLAAAWHGRTPWTTST